MEHLLAALTFGLVAGLKPGPLGIFIIDQTMRHGPSRGFTVSLAPFITDGPIIALALVLSLGVKGQATLVSVVSILGALYIAYLAVRILKTSKEVDFGKQSGASSGLKTSIKINLLNPSPYLFWLTIGGSYIVSASYVESGLFVLVALTVLCATKFIVALLVFNLGQRLNTQMYGHILKSLAIPLFYFSGSLFYDGVTHLIVV